MVRYRITAIDTLAVALFTLSALSAKPGGSNDTSPNSAKIDSLINGAGVGAVDDMRSTVPASGKPKSLPARHK